MSSVNRLDIIDRNHLIFVRRQSRHEPLWSRLFQNFATASSHRGHKKHLVIRARDPKKKKVSGKAKKMS